VKCDLALFVFLLLRLFVVLEIHLHNVERVDFLVLIVVIFVASLIVCLACYLTPAWSWLVWLEANLVLEGFELGLWEFVMAWSDGPSVFPPLPPVCWYLVQPPRVVFRRPEVRVPAAEVAVAAVNDCGCHAEEEEDGDDEVCRPPGVEFEHVEARRLVCGGDGVERCRDLLTSRVLLC